jgi:hypothetical protein
MASMVFGDSTLESLTPSVNAPLVWVAFVMKTVGNSNNLKTLFPKLGISNLL